MSDDSALVVMFMDVGQGDATIIVLPDDSAIVFDCGREGTEVVNQLNFNGIQRLRAIIASHLDLDHIGGMATVLDAFSGSIDTVYISPDRDISPDTDNARQAKELIDKAIEGGGTAFEVLSVQRSPVPIAQGPDWSVCLLAPRGASQLKVHRIGEWEDPNRYSAILRIERAGKVVLVGADAPLATWAETPQGEIAADVFRIPHHGGALSDGGVPEEWSVDRLYELVKPNVAVVSVGTSNRHRHPETETWIKPLIGQSGCRLLCTQVTGRCHPPFERDDQDRQATAIQEARSRWVPDHHGGNFHFSEPPWRHYRMHKTGKLGASRKDRPEVPCAGTINVRLPKDGNLRVDPDPESPGLDARISGWDRPLCRA